MLDLFDQNGHLTDKALQALTWEEDLNELQRLEISEYNLNKRYWHLLSAIYEPDFPNLPGNCNACNKRCPTLPVL